MLVLEESIGTTEPTSIGPYRSLSRFIQVALKSLLYPSGMLVYWSLHLFFLLKLLYSSCSCGVLPPSLSTFMSSTSNGFQCQVLDWSLIQSVQPVYKNWRTTRMHRAHTARAAWGWTASMLHHWAKESDRFTSPRLGPDKFANQQSLHV
jgi:hypothetical protein